MDKYPPSSQTGGRIEAVGFKKVGRRVAGSLEWIFGEGQGIVIQVMKEEPAVIGPAGDQ